VNTDELASALSVIGIPEQLYIVSDTAEYAWCLVGEGDVWEVFWMERGTKGDLQRFANENQACTYLLGRFTYSQILAGLAWGDES
jgi:hypothetical protein